MYNIQYIKINQSKKEMVIPTHDQYIQGCFLASTNNIGSALFCVFVFLLLKNHACRFVSKIRKRNRNSNEVILQLLFRGNVSKFEQELQASLRVSSSFPKENTSLPVIVLILRSLTLMWSCSTGKK